MTLPQFELTRWFAFAEGKFDHSLGHSGCESIPISSFCDSAEVQELLDQPMGYGDFDGLQAFQEVVAKQYATIEPQDVCTLNGPSEGIYTFMRAMLESGDQVVVQTPLFQSLHAVAEHIGCEMREWRPRDEFENTFDVDDLAKLCDENTKLLVINFPHNPSGQMISEAELQRVVAIAERSNAMIFSDECFRLLELSPQQPLPAVCDLYENAVSLSGLSKPYGLGGLRTGWIATRSSKVRNALKEYRFYTSEMSNTPCQWFGTRAIQKAEEIVGRNRKLIASNLRLLERLVESHDELLKLQKPMGGTMALVRQQTGLTSTEFCKKALNEERLFLIPSKPLGMPDNYLRIGLGTTDFEESLSHFERFLRRQD